MKKAARNKQAPFVTELFNITANDFDAKKPSHFYPVFALTELVLNEIQYTTHRVVLSEYGSEYLSTSPSHPSYRIIYACLMFQSVLNQP